MTLDSSHNMEIIFLASKHLQVTVPCALISIHRVISGAFPDLLEQVKLRRMILPDSFPSVSGSH